LDDRRRRRLPEEVAGRASPAVNGREFDGVARCLEVAWAAGTCLAILGMVQDWQEVMADARTVERIVELTGWGVFTAVYRVESDSGRRRHYFVAEV
jgi:hypothetical protein